MTALKFPSGYSGVGLLQVSQSAVPCWFGHGDQAPEPPGHVEVTCAKAPAAVTLSNTSVMSARRSALGTDVVRTIAGVVGMPSSRAKLNAGPKRKDRGRVRGRDSGRGAVLETKTL